MSLPTPVETVMPRWWKSPAEQLLELEQRAAHYRRAGALIMKTRLERVLAQAEADAGLVEDLARFDPIREYAADGPRGAIRACAICKATARGAPVDHEASCLWLRAARATRERVPISADLPDTELLSGPRH
jgi:hypothetical protein